MSSQQTDTKSALLKPIVDKHYPTVAYGKGVFLYDTEGKEYLDGSSGAMTASIGHGLEEISEVAQKQARCVAFAYRSQFTNTPAEDLAKKLTELAPGDLNWAFFVSSGSEATEFAIRAAVGHWREKNQPDKVKILGRHISYHGMTMGALSLSGHPARRTDYGSLLHPFPVTPAAYPYRNSFPDESEHEYAERAAREFEEAIIKEDPRTVAAIIVEPIVGAAGGVLVPPAGYLKKLREICDRLNILLIVDEVITGIGRTGDWFASLHEDIVPDLLLLGKGLSGGYTPMAGVLLRQHMVETLRDGTGVAPFGHTFSGNPLGCAVCVGILDFFERKGVLENVKKRGFQLQKGLEELSNRFNFMADVRGRGLLWGFEFVTDKKSKKAPNPEYEISQKFVEKCLSEGLIVYPAGIAPLNNAILISPPLVISEGETILLLERLEKALETMDV